ncbi:hypothetical protein LCGC14_2046520 [marine sediment metagenome]|uniref:Uncharacterized protein n=1 Tax=marine sediment metagenome TaxID=412755 RepID=A0A0F9EQA8_9ZZZZ
MWNLEREGYWQNRIRELVKKIKVTMLITPSPTERGEFIKWLAKEIDKLADPGFNILNDADHAKVEGEGK